MLRDLFRIVGTFAQVLTFCTAASCTSPVQVQIYTEHPNPDAVLAEASALLGVPLEPGRGPIVVEIVEAAKGEYVGRLLARRHCLRIIRSSPDHIVLAHELGHAFGLGHHDDPANLMHARTGDDTTELEDWQRDIIEAAAARLGRCP